MYTGGRGERLLEYTFIDSAAFVLRGLMANNGFKRRLTDAGPEAPALIDSIMSKDCLVSAWLTEADRARLLQIKQDATLR